MGPKGRPYPIDDIGYGSNAVLLEGEGVVGCWVVLDGGSLVESQVGVVVTHLIPIGVVERAESGVHQQQRDVAVENGSEPFPEFSL